MKSVAVIPAFNEGKRIAPIIKVAAAYVDEIIIVDDGSTDNTAHVISSFGKDIKYLRHRINLGKGAALKTGCEAGIKLGADIIVLMDGDGQHKPEDIPRFIETVEKKGAHIVFGSRKIGKDMPLVMMLGNKFLSLATSILFRIYISDTQSGFRAIRSEAYKKIKWNSSRYAVETEMIVNAGKHKLPHAEIAIDTIYTDRYKGTTIIDGIRIFFNMLMWRII